MLHNRVFGSSTSRSLFRFSAVTKRFESNRSLSAKNIKTEADRQEYLHQANKEMSKYHETREQMRKGLLKSKYERPSSSSSSTHAAQLSVVALFLVAFLVTPFVGKKIAQDKEFREKYIPKWYDFTLKEEKGWTREELHEQMLLVQKDIRERAIRGEFTPDNLRKMQHNLDVTARPDVVPDERSAAWDKIHPGMLDEDEDELNEG